MAVFILKITIEAEIL